MLYKKENTKKKKTCSHVITEVFVMGLSESKEENEFEMSQVNTRKMNSSMGF